MTAAPELLPDAVFEGFNKVLGLRWEIVTPDRVVACLTIGKHLLQPYGILHGGVLCSVVESVGSVAGAVWFGDRGQVVGVANSTSFLRASREGELTATATPVHRGRTSQLWRVDVSDAQERLVAHGELRLANITTAEGLGRS